MKSNFPYHVQDGDLNLEDERMRFYILQNFFRSDCNDYQHYLFVVYQN